jgi:RNA polymerase sigma factor (sigma-70 family)
VPRGRDENGAGAAPDVGTAGAEAAVLYERYAARIQGFCMRRLGDHDEAADAVQDTFLRAWLALRKGEQVRNPLPWLQTIADNVCVSRFRARGARVATTALTDEDGVYVPDAAGEAAGLAAALRALPERQRQALLRREVQGYSYDEIGAELGVSRASVAALLHRARLAVADKLREARRGAAALFPIPAMLRAPFESGASGLAAAGTAAVAIAVTPLADPSPASPAPPRSAAGTALAVGAEHALASTTRARPSSRANAHVVPETGPTGSARAEVGRAGGGGEIDAPRGSGSVPASLAPAEAAPSPGEDLPTATPPAEAESAPDAGPQDPAGEPAPTAVDPEQPEEDVPARGRPGVEVLPPGHQPKGSRGRSAYAPGQTKQPGGAPVGDPPGAGHGPGGNPDKRERDQPPSETDGDEPTRRSDPDGGSAPGSDDPPRGNAGAGQSAERQDDTEPKGESKGDGRGKGDTPPADRP